MSVLVVGMSHQSAPVALLEQLSMDNTIQHDTCSRLVDCSALSEAMIVSTCNRLEVYAVTNSFHMGVQEVVGVLADVSDVPADTLRGYLYVRYADAAAEHLMTVTSGLDSMVIGEQQLIGQVRTAYQAATEEGTVGPRLHALAQAALHVGKRVHSETDIDAAGASMVSFAFDQALTAMEASDLAGQRVLILGAGAMASLAATHAGRLGAAELVIANRTLERAENLAQHAEEAGVKARAVPFTERCTQLAEVDMAVSATGSDSFTITAADLPAKETAAAHRPLMLVDLSLPRDIDDAVAEHHGVRLVNIESLSNSLQAANTEVAAATDPRQAAERIVAEELDSYTSAQRVRDVAPAIGALHRRAADVVACELGRLRQKSPELTEQQVDDVRQALKRVADKLLHEPTVRAKKLAADSGTVDHATALQELFGFQLEGTGVAVEAAELPDLPDLPDTHPERKDA